MRQIELALRDIRLTDSRALLGLCVIPAVVMCGAVNISAAESENPVPTTLHAKLSETGQPGYHEVLVRDLGAASAIEFDVVGESNVVVSFITAFGAGERARCEAIYLDDDAWFGWCDVYDIAFGSFEELSDQMPECVNCTAIHRYAFGANSGLCGASLLGESSAAQTFDLAVQAASEIAQWDANLKNALRDSLVLIGANGCPKLCQELIEVFELSRDPIVTEPDLSIVNEPPKSIMNQFDLDRTSGLGEWLDHVVNGLP